MKTMNNKKLGNSFEEELCEILAGHGFWAHNMAQNETGQPADVIAVRNNIAVLIDCKVCTHDKFALSRIEPNQEASMSLWEETGSQHCYFAMKTSKGIYMVHYDELKNRDKDLKEFGTTIEEWLGDICKL